MLTQLGRQLVEGDRVVRDVVSDVHYEDLLEAGVVFVGGLYAYAEGGVGLVVEAGVSNEQIDTMLIDTPKQFLESQNLGGY